MTPDQERWAEALQILRWKREAATAYVEERIDALNAAHDQAGAARFSAIRERLVRLRAGTVQ